MTMRPYHGIDTRVSDAKVRLALQEIDMFLREATREMSVNAAETPQAVNSTARFLVLALHSGLTAERRAVVSAPIVAVDSGANGSWTLSLDNAAPALGLGTTNVAGPASSAPLRVDATVALFDTVVPSNLAGTAATGSVAFGARRDHVHLWPEALRSIAATAGDTLTLTSDGTDETLTGSRGRLKITPFGASVTMTKTLVAEALTQLATVSGNVIIGRAAGGFIRANTDNVSACGQSAQRWSNIFSYDGDFQDSVIIRGNLQVDVSLTGPFTIAKDWNPDLDATYVLGDATLPKRWLRGAFSDSISVGDALTAFNLLIASDSSPNFTANRTLTLDLGDAARTLTITGNATLPVLAFKTISTPAGTSPVADSETDTLTLAATNMTITGSAPLDAVTFAVPDADAVGTKGVLTLATHLAGTAAAPQVIGLLEQGGPTSLLYGSIADGLLLKRSATAVIGLAKSAAYTPTNVTTDRAYDANATTLDELADVVGTMIADLQAAGVFA